MEQKAPLFELNPTRARADAVAVPEFTGITPPWHVQHAKALIAAAALVVVGGIAGAFYYIQHLRSDSVLRMRVSPDTQVPAQALPVPVAPPAPRAPAVGSATETGALPVPREAAKSAAAAAGAKAAEPRLAGAAKNSVARADSPGPAQAPRMALPVPASPPAAALTGAAAAVGASPAASKPAPASSVPAITHTRRSEPPVPASATRPDAPRRGGCSEAAEILGLCEDKK